MEEMVNVIRGEEEGGTSRVGNGVLTTATWIVQTAEFIAYDSLWAGYGFPRAVEAVGN